jgi:two-component system sensor histidine kinase DegS
MGIQMTEQMVPGEQEPASLWAFQLLEETSKRLAERVSDGPGQLLANAIFELAASIKLMDQEPELAKQGLMALEEEMRVGLRATQHLIFELSPPPLHSLGLVTTIRNYVKRFQDETGLPVELEIQFPPERLPMTLEVMVFRILQEALTNVRQHAKPQQVWVSLRNTPEFLELTIEDDGVGLDFRNVATGRQRHLGLVSMHDRARMVGGTLTISNRADSGTRVHLMAPRTLRA